MDPWTQSHNGPIEGSWVRRHLTLIAVVALKRFRPHASSVLFLTNGLCVKYSPFQHLSDAATMQYIASHTSIPVPKVHCAFERKGTTYIVMSRIAGSPIGHEWEQRPKEGGISASPEQIPEVNELIKKQESSQSSTRFTHGDLNSMNVLVKGDDVVGIIDWDTAGWYPEYWEYTTASNVSPYNEFWKDEICKFLEQVRQKYFGAF
ncbi:kinase-like protein [Mytilinidion resinicola]|uniref:Kinase-like protein n=1 Tax=Mytilinidion resinicola TaxID=574789 RepID=A0A6A6Z280_9PEZI|nr:kinase-like protein [Mytilinidion resinicola]KAF2814337.1 kinase-like protein [Mytilinidion resinicola]